jgi:hypothetical protein
MEIADLLGGHSMPYVCCILNDSFKPYFCCTGSDLLGGTGILVLMYAAHATRKKGPGNTSSNGACTHGTHVTSY